MGKQMIHKPSGKFRIVRSELAGTAVASRDG
jgi:hypothetical protein